MILLLMFSKIVFHLKVCLACSKYIDNAHVEGAHQLVEDTGQVSSLAATPAICQSPTILAAPRIAPSATAPPFTAHASQRPAFKRSIAEKPSQRHLRQPLSKYHCHFSAPHRRRDP